MSWLSNILSSFADIIKGWAKTEQMIVVFAVLVLTAGYFIMDRYLDYKEVIATTATASTSNDKEVRHRSLAGRIDREEIKIAAQGTK